MAKSKHSHRKEAFKFDFHGCRPVQAFETQIAGINIHSVPPRKGRG
jgi:hypothetical protein